MAIYAFLKGTGFSPYINAGEIAGLYRMREIL
jgi:hypothetical protein